MEFQNQNEKINNLKEDKIQSDEQFDINLQRNPSTFSRSNRGKRIEPLDEEAKRKDDEFWKNNPLFKDLGDDDEDNFGDEDFEENYEESDVFDSDFGLEEDSQSQASKSTLENKNKGQLANPNDLFIKTNSEEDKKEEKLEADPHLEIYIKNRKDYNFFRPILWHCDINKCERISRSYIRIPPDYKLSSSSSPISPLKALPKIAKDNINDKYIGVAPNAPGEYKSSYISLPNRYEYDIFRIEDNLSMQDTNIQKMKKIIDYIQSLIDTKEHDKKFVEFQAIIKANKTVRAKSDIFDIDDTIDTKLQKLKNALIYDLEELIKKRKHYGNVIKKNQAIHFSMALKKKETKLIDLEKLIIKNSYLIDEAFSSHRTLPNKLYDLNNQLKEKYDLNKFNTTYYDIMNKYMIKHPVIKSDMDTILIPKLKTLHEQYLQNESSTLPTYIFAFTNEEVFADVIKLISLTIQNSLHNDPKLLYRYLQIILEQCMNIQIQGNMEFINNQIDTYVIDLVKKVFPNAKYENIVSPNLRECKAQIKFMNKEKSQNKKLSGLFLPITDNQQDISTFFGIHSLFLFFRLLSSLYQKLLIAYSLSNKIIKREKDENQMSYYALYLRLTSANMIGTLEETLYHYCLFAGFPDEVTYLINTDRLIDAIIKQLDTMIEDKVSKNILDWYQIAEKNIVQDEKLTLVEICSFDFVNRDKDKEINYENLLYRTSWDPKNHLIYLHLIEPTIICNKIAKIKTIEHNTTIKAYRKCDREDELNEYIMKTNSEMKVIFTKNEEKDENKSISANEMNREPNSQQLLGKRKNSNDLKNEENSSTQLKKCHF